MTKSDNPAIKKLIAHINKHGKDRSWTDLSKMFAPELHDDWARTTLRRLGYDVKTDQFTVEKKVEFTKYHSDIKKVDKQNKHLVDKIIELEKDINLLTGIKNHKTKSFSIGVPANNKSHEATAVIQWSDWHVDEIVKPSTVNGLNEYNPTIAEQRAKALFQNTVKLVNTQRSGVLIKNLVIHLGGDIVTAWIHPEGMQTNSMTPQEGIFFAYDLHIAGIEYILKLGGFDLITIICSRGNHGRVTPKMQFGNDYSTNNENYMYKMLANRFRGNSKINFILDDSELSYLTVYNQTLRFFHGWQIKFQGGIGGLTIPLYKSLHRWNANTKAYYNFMCDKHSYSCPTPDCVLNGSLIGFSTYALSHGFSYEPPRQSFTLLDSKRGVTIKAPIFCE